MKTKISILLSLLLAFACGAPIPLEYGPEPEEMGEAEQAISAELNGGGWRLDGEQVQKLCGGNSTSQKCVLPPSKTIGVQLDVTGMDPADVTIANTQFHALIAALNTQFSGTGYSWATVLQSPNLVVKDGTVSNFVGTTDIRAHVRLACSNLSGALTEPAGGLNGTWHRCQTIQATVDYDKIFETFGAGSTTQVIKHAIGSALIAAAGIGVNAGHTGRITSQTTSTANKSSTVDARERCRMLKLNLSNQSNITLTNDC
jgi:hypothetical protein